MNNDKKDNKKIAELEDDQQFEAIYNDLPPIDIVAFNELRSCHDLLRLYETKQLEIKPDFQRDVVWTLSDQTRFIDSLTKQLPIPSMCISIDYKTEKRIVIDGLQRIYSIVKFLSDKKWRLAKLIDVDIRLSGKVVSEIIEKHQDIYDRVQNLMIPITVIRCDYSNKYHNEYLFTIFHRLNSGGVRLNNQEIRNCIYNGSLNNLLKELASHPQTKKILKNGKRFTNEELILRFFTFNDRLTSYDGNLSAFLNQYMFENRNLDDDAILSKQEIYLKTLKIIHEKLFANQQVPTRSKTLTEGLLYGISQNIQKLRDSTTEETKLLYGKFISLPEFSVENLKSDLSAKDKVINRLEASKNCFS